MKAFIVTHRHNVIGIFRDIAKAGECAERVATTAEPDPDCLWDKSASIAIKDVETDLL